MRKGYRFSGQGFGTILGLIFGLITLLAFPASAQKDEPNSFRYGNGAHLEAGMSLSGLPNQSGDLDDAASMITLYSMYPSDAVSKGIDVSSHQRSINWDVVAKYIDFAFIRCGYGDDYTSQDDAYWEANVSACERLGIPYGVYLYSYALNKGNAVSEASHALRLLKGHHPSLPVFYDLEEQALLNTCSKAQILEFTQIFCNAIENAGYQPGVYTGQYWWDNYLTDPAYNKWEKWVAQYNSMCTYNGTYNYWQYTGSGTLPGISYPVDMNYCRKPISELINRPVTKTEPDKPVVKSSYTITIAGTVDGKNQADLGNAGTFDVYVNNTKKVNDVTAYTAKLEEGTTIQIKDVKAKGCYRYDGVSSGSSSVKLSKNTTVRLAFTKAHNYVEEEIKGTCTTLPGKMYTCKGCGDNYIEMEKDSWTSWSEVYPEGKNPDFIESRTEYSYSDKKTTTSEKSSLSGWTRVGKKTQYTAWSAWSAWQKKKITASENVKVDTAKVYRYYAYVCPVCGDREPLSGISDCGRYVLGSKDKVVKWSTTAYKNSKSAKCKNADGKNRRYTTALGDNKIWIFDGANLNNTSVGTVNTSKVLVIMKGYRGRTRKKTTVYTYEKWTDYTAWSKTKATNSTTRIVKTRKVYRYNKTQKIDHTYNETSIKNNKIYYECKKCHGTYDKPLLTMRLDGSKRVLTVTDTTHIKSLGVIYVKDKNGTLSSSGCVKKTLKRAAGSNTVTHSPDLDLLKKGYLIRGFITLDTGTTFYV